MGAFSRGSYKVTYEHRDLGDCVLGHVISDFVDVDAAHRKNWTAKNAVIVYKTVVEVDVLKTSVE